MQLEDLQRVIEQGLPGSKVMVSGDGSHFQATIINEAFEGKSLVQKQKMVYGTLGDRISSGEIHALSIKTYTPKEWEEAEKLHILQ